MQGRYRLQIKNAKGLSDEYFLQAIHDKRIDKVLDDLETEYTIKGRNLLNHWWFVVFAHNVIEHGFSNGPYYTYDNCNAFNNICMTTKSTEPTHDETYTWSGGYDGAQDNIGDATAAKGFVNERAEDTLVEVDSDGRESMFHRTRWIFLPSESISNNLRGFTINGARMSNQTIGTEFRYQTGRILFKDPVSGNPVAVLKNLNQVLVLEYTLRLVSL